MIGLCQYNEITSYICGLPEKVGGQVYSALAAALVGSVLATFGNLFTLLKPRNWRMAGRWHRYGVSFYPTNGVQTIHSARVFILPIPPLMIALSFNKTYSYVGSLKFTDMLYIHWKGMFHEETMLSVYESPLVVNEETIIVGVKSCITKYREPAANKEILTRKALTQDRVLEMVGSPDSRIIVQDKNEIKATYEI